jgi:predicted enzyme related to lactoylglutathione lyase
MNYPETPPGRGFDPSRSPFMLNFRVDDLNALLTALRAEGVEVDEKIEEYDYGRFAWIRDPEGNRIELWEPAK